MTIDTTAWSIAMQGLWVCTVTKDHPFAFEPNTGPVTPSQEFHVGEVFKDYEGTSTVFINSFMTAIKRA